MIKQLLILLIILLIVLLILFNSNTNILNVFQEEHFNTEDGTLISINPDNVQTNVSNLSNLSNLNLPNQQSNVMDSSSEESNKIKMHNLNDPNNSNNIMYIRGEDDSGKCKSLSSKQCGSDTGKCSPYTLYPIMDPKFNMREAAKQCLLLEDHLNNTKKRCYDCIRKHFLTTDGFLEEAVSLEKDNTMRDYYRKLYSDWVKIEKTFAKNPTDSNNLDNVSKEIRGFRKPLLEQYFDNVSEYND